jgi:multicomponent Na+:H+ antiporter subunit D
VRPVSPWPGGLAVRYRYLLAGVLIAALLLWRVLAEGPISYPMGNWAAPWGIEYRVDVLNAYMLVLVTSVGAVIMSFSRLIVEHRIRLPEHKQPWFYTAYMLCLTGLLGIIDHRRRFQRLRVSGNLFAVQLRADQHGPRPPRADGLLSVPDHGHDRRHLHLIGIGLLYVMTGTLNMADWPRASGSGRYAHRCAALAFLTVGVSAEAGAVPAASLAAQCLHLRAFGVTAFLAATATKVAIYVLLRFFFTIFGAQFSFETMRLDFILMPLALVGIFSASLVAIFQTNVKRMLAYSSVAQIGYMILGISLVSVTGLTASISHLFNHALMKGALFMALAAYRFGSALSRSTGWPGWAGPCPGPWARS